jgi:membrane-associated protease RseP (regulator of RpoE activity)
MLIIVHMAGARLRVALSGVERFSEPLGDHLHLYTKRSLHGLLESLDPQSSYLTPREYDEYKKKSQNSGTGETGLTLSKRYGYVIVLSVLPDSPGTKAGVRSGDIFESIGGFTTRDMSVGQALNLLSGQPGSGIKVAVIRRGKATPDEVDLVRDLPRRGGVDVGDDDRLRALGGEPPAQGASNAIPAAGDDGNLAGQFHPRVRGSGFTVQGSFWVPGSEC